MLSRLNIKLKQVYIIDVYIDRFIYGVTKLVLDVESCSIAQCHLQQYSGKLKE